MTIPWIPCSERMPPDDDSKVICKFSPRILMPVRETTGKFVHLLVAVFMIKHHRMSWIPYDEAIWRKLNAV